MELRLVNVIEAWLGFKVFGDVVMGNRGLCLVKKETVGRGFSLSFYLPLFCGEIRMKNFKEFRYNFAKFTVKLAMLLLILPKFCSI